MAAWRRLGILRSWPAALQSRLSILQSRPVSPQSPPRRSSVLVLYFDQLRAPFTESTPPAAAKSHAPFTGSAPLLPPKSHVSFAGFAPSKRFARCKKVAPQADFLFLSPGDGFRTGLEHPRKTTMRGSARPWGHPRGDAKRRDGDQDDTKG